MRTNKLVQSYERRLRLLLFLFQLLALSLVFLYERRFTMRSIGFALALILLSLLTSYFFKKMTGGENLLMYLANLMFTIGVVMIYRLDPANGEKQLVIYAFSVLLMIPAFYFLKRTGDFWKDKTFFFYGLTVLTFLITLGLAGIYRGARNWIEIGGISVQLSEIAKIFFAFFLAGYYRNREKYEQKMPLKILQGPLLPMLLTYLLIGLFFLQRELGTAIVFYMAFLAVQVVFEEDKKYILLNIVLACIGLFVAYQLFSHVRVRFDIWRDPWSTIETTGYQITQSLFAIGAGGFTGTGIGLGMPQMIPLGESDFIFASIIEELGGMMGIAIILLYIIFVYRSMKIAREQNALFYKVLAVAISTMFFAQAFIMFGGVMKVIPLTGITIPFISYGGSSLVTSFLLLTVLGFCSMDMTEGGSHAE